jgi:hypothetical protein
MCDPISIGALGTTLASASAAVGSMSSIMAPIALGASVGGMALDVHGQLSQGKFTQELARRNALEADILAKNARLRGDQKATAERLQHGALAAKQQVGAAAVNLDIGSGSAVDIIADTKYMGYINAAAHLQNSEYEARALENKRDNLLAQGDEARRVSKLKAFQTVLGGVSKIASGFPNFFKGGAEAGADVAALSDGDFFMPEE